MREVFISHSARGDAFAMAVLTKIEEGLKAKGFRPLVDQTEIPPGGEWRPWIVDWLARCDAAVVLLNEKALTSDWVKREVNILMWRRALGARLTVVPVLLGDVTTGAVKQAGMEELRPIQFARTPRGVQPDADDLSSQVLAQFADLPGAAAGGDPMSKWLTRLAEYLSEAQRSGALAKAATALNLEDVHLAHVTAQQGGCLFLAHQFLVARAERMEEALHELAPSLKDGTLRRLIAELTSIWVNEEAARRVLPALGERPHQMTLLLNAQAQSTARDYIGRATCGATSGYEVNAVGSLPTGEDRVGERFRTWEQAVWTEFFDAATEDDRVLPRDLLDRTHYLVITESRSPDSEFAAAVKLLHNAFSWLIVLVTTGTAVPEQQVQAAFTNPVLLTPLLTAEDEATARARNKRLKKLPDRLTGAY